MHILRYTKHLKLISVCELFQQWAAEKLQKSASICKSSCQGDKIVEILWCQKYQLEDAEVKKRNWGCLCAVGKKLHCLRIEKIPA